MCECMQLYAESKFEKKKVTVCNECRAWQVLHDYPSSSRSVMLDVARMVEKLLWAHQIDKRKGSLTWPYNAHPAPMGASHAPRSCSTSCLRLTSWLSAHAVGWIILLKKQFSVSMVMISPSPSSTITTSFYSWVAEGYVALGGGLCADLFAALLVFFDMV